jgi:hypothetical protein
MNALALADGKPFLQEPTSKRKLARNATLFCRYAE